MRNLMRRLDRLEARLTDGSGCVAHSEAWFTYWTRQAERLLAGENVTKPPLAFFDALLASPGQDEHRIRCTDPRFCLWFRDCSTTKAPTESP
jgi:hypothetical protein